MIVRRLVVGYLSSNCYIVGSEAAKEGLIIDPGGDARGILKTVKDVGLDIKVILLTHGHSDHIAALSDVYEATKAEVAVHAEDAQFLRGRGSVSMMFGISYRTPSAPGRLLEDGDSIDIGDLHFSVVHTPGHTPGCICLLGDDIVFTGDTLFYHGIGTAMMPGSSRSQMINSIHTRLMTLPDNTIVYPGHGRQTTIGAERRGNPFLHGR